MYSCIVSHFLIYTLSKQKDGKAQQLYVLEISSCKAEEIPAKLGLSRQLLEIKLLFSVEQKALYRNLFIKQSSPNTNPPI